MSRSPTSKRCRHFRRKRIKRQGKQEDEKIEEELPAKAAAASGQVGGGGTRGHGARTWPRRCACPIRRRGRAIAVVVIVIRHWDLGFWLEWAMVRQSTDETNCLYTHCPFFLVRSSFFLSNTMYQWVELGRVVESCWVLSPARTKQDWRGSIVQPWRLPLLLLLLLWLPLFIDDGIDGNTIITTTAVAAAAIE